MTGGRAIQRGLLCLALCACAEDLTVPSESERADGGATDARPSDARPRDVGPIDGGQRPDAAPEPPIGDIQTGRPPVSFGIGHDDRIELVDYAVVYRPGRRPALSTVLRNRSAETLCFVSIRDLTYTLAAGEPLFEDLGRFIDLGTPRQTSTDSVTHSCLGPGQRGVTFGRVPERADIDDTTRLTAIELRFEVGSGEYGAPNSALEVAEMVVERADEDWFVSATIINRGPEAATPSRLSATFLLLDLAGLPLDFSVESLDEGVVLAPGDSVELSTDRAFRGLEVRADRVAVSIFRSDR